jgi:hypothetical protein
MTNEQVNVADVADLARSKKGGIGAPLAGLFVPAPAAAAGPGPLARLPADGGHVRVRDATSANKTVCT